MDAKTKVKKEDDKMNQKKREKAYIKKSFPLPPQPENYKQIEMNNETGKLELIDYKKGIINCDIFGNPIKTFYKNTTGIKNYKHRLQNGLIKKVNCENPTQYFPGIQNLEGGSMFPRPLSIPFVNDMNKPKLLIDEIKKEKRMKLTKNEKCVSLEEPPRDATAVPDYISCNLANKSNKDKKRIINLIDTYIEEQKEINKLNPSFIKKNEKIKALKEYRQIFTENLNKNCKNGIKYSSPTQKDIKEKYKIIKNMSKINGYKTMHLENDNINLDIYTKLYSVKSVGNNKNIFKPQNLYKLKNKHLNQLDIPLSYENNNKIIKRIGKEKNKTEYFRSIFDDENTKTNFNKNFDLSNEDNRIATLTSTNFATNKLNQQNLGQKNKSTKTLTKKNNKIYSPIFKEFNSTILDKNKDLTDQILADVKYKNIKNNIRTISDIKLRTTHENILLEGFKIPEEKEEMFFVKHKKPNLLTGGDHFIQEIELFNLVNPIAAKKEKDNKEYEDMILKKKLMSKKIYERIKIQN